MTEPDYASIGRYTACMDQFDALAAERAATLDALARWSATTQVGGRNVRKLGLEALDDYVRKLHQQQDQLTQLARLINALAPDLDRPGVRFVAHQVL